MKHFEECDECRVKPGSPTLCSDCLERRTKFYKTGRCRKPKACSLQSRAAAKAYDMWKEALNGAKLPPLDIEIIIVDAERPE